MPFDPHRLELGRPYTRPELATLWGYRGHEAISRGVVTPAGGGHILLFVTRQKQASLTQFRDFLNGDYLHWEGESRHGTDDRIAYAHTRGESIHLFYRDIHHTPFRYQGPLEIIEFQRRKDKPSEFLFRLVHDLGPEDDISLHAQEMQELEETEREALLKARRGQGGFRHRLLRRWGGCSLTAVDAPELLRASHVKPWRYSTNAERLSEFNGLLLLPQYDHLFDRGYITFDHAGALVPFPVICLVPPELLGIQMGLRLREMAEEQLPFLDFHRNEVFIDKR